LLAPLALIRLGQGKATGYRLADVPEQPERRWLGAKFGGYAVESGYGAFACGGAAKALDAACGAAFDEGDLDHPQSQMLREQLTHPDAQARGWGSGELVPVMREGSLVAFSAGHGEGFYPSYWGYDAERRLVSLVTDFLVLPTDPELIRASWAGRTWRELHYDGDRGQRFWRVKVKGRVRTIEHGHVGRRGQSSQKQFTTSEAALEAAAKGIHRQLDAGYFELSSSASDLRHAMSGVSPKLAAKGPRRRPKKARPAKVSLETETAASEAPRGRTKPKWSSGGKERKPGQRDPLLALARTLPVVRHGDLDREASARDLPAEGLEAEPEPEGIDDGDSVALDRQAPDPARLHRRSARPERSDRGSCEADCQLPAAVAHANHRPRSSVPCARRNGRWRLSTSSPEYGERASSRSRAGPTRLGFCLKCLPRNWLRDQHRVERDIA